MGKDISEGCRSGKKKISFFLEFITWLIAEFKMKK